MSDQITGADIVIYEGSGEWSALYVKGKLDRVGDHYLAAERVNELLGVELIQSDDFMRGGEYRQDVAATLGDLEAYTLRREAAEREAADLRAQADELLRRASKLVDG